MWESQFETVNSYADLNKGKFLEKSVLQQALVRDILLSGFTEKKCTHMHVLVILLHATWSRLLGDVARAVAAYAICLLNFLVLQIFFL